MEGWVQLHRKVRENWLWKDPVKFQWWVDILMEANHKENEVPIGFKVLKCKRGETIRSLQGWAQRWRVGKGVVKNFLTMLERQGMITLKNETVTTRLTICKYDCYQSNQNGSETRGNRKATARQPQGGTNNNDNNANNEKNENKNIPALKDFIDYAIEKEPSVDINEVRLKYLAWVENGWKDGNDRQVKNWKSKLLNTMLHLKKDETKTEKKTSIKF